VEIILELLFLILMAGAPYFYFLKNLQDKTIFYIVALSLIIGTIFSHIIIHTQFMDFIIVISIASSIFAILQAYKTTNIYKLSYLFIFISSPLFFIIDSQYSLWFIISILVNTAALFRVGIFFEQRYGIANFYSITALVTNAPKLAFFFKLYLLSLALFPPFPNFIFAIDILLTSEMNFINLLAFVVVFLGSFFIAMSILTRTIFGKENKNIYYATFKAKDFAIHLSILGAIVILGAYGLMEVLV
jgi:hypothetical protein